MKQFDRIDFIRLTCSLCPTLQRFLPVLSFLPCQMEICFVNVVLVKKLFFVYSIHFVGDDWFTLISILSGMTGGLVSLKQKNSSPRNLNALDNYQTRKSGHSDEATHTANRKRLQMFFVC